MSKNFSQKGLTKNFLKLMKQEEENRECCLDFLTHVFTQDSATVLFTGFGTRNNPLIATAIGGGGSGSTDVITGNSSSITFGGNGTESSPLTATVIGASPVIQVSNASSNVTIANGTNILYVDPASLVDNLVITLPAVPPINNEVEIYFGGTIKSGTVISFVNIQPNGGQSLLQSFVVTSANAGDSILYNFRPSTSTWYRKA